MTARTICHSRCSGTSCQPSNGDLSSLGFGYLSSSALAATKNPGVQSALQGSVLQEFHAGVGAAGPVKAKPSTVSTLRPCTSTPNTRHELTKRPSSRTLHHRSCRCCSLLCCQSKQLVAQHFEQTLAAARTETRPACR